VFRLTKWVEPGAVSWVVELQSGTLAMREAVGGSRQASAGRRLTGTRPFDNGGGKTLRGPGRISKKQRRLCQLEL
jgi:hypothetical protein